MATSTSSKLLSVSKNNATLQTLLRRHLLRPTTPSATQQLLNPATLDQQIPNTAQMMKEKKKNAVPVADNMFGGFVLPMGMMGFPGVDRSGILRAIAGSDGTFGFESDTDMEDSDGDFGFEIDSDDGRYDDDNDDPVSDEEDGSEDR